MTYDLSGKNVLVTGASAGLGAALAEGFARRGATVGICARREDRLTEVLERVRAHAPGSRMWTVDLAHLDGIAGFAARVESEMGGVDVLVNNAGIPKRRRVTDLTPEVVESVMALNYFSPVRLTLALLPTLRARRGRVVNISSVAARLGPPGEAAYSASKAALSAFSEGAHVDLADDGVKFLIVDPGVFDTELFTLPDNDPFVASIEMMAPADIVDPVLGALEAGRIEIAVPEWFHDIFAGKFGDLNGFIEGAIAFDREQKAKAP